MLEHKLLPSTETSISLHLNKPHVLGEKAACVCMCVCVCACVFVFLSVQSRHVLMDSPTCGKVLPTLLWQLSSILHSSAVNHPRTVSALTEREIRSWKLYYADRQCGEGNGERERKSKRERKWARKKARKRDEGGDKEKGEDVIIEMKANLFCWDVIKAIDSRFEATPRQRLREEAERKSFDGSCFKVAHFLKWDCLCEYGIWNELSAQYVHFILIGNSMPVDNRILCFLKIGRASCRERV